MARSNLCVSDAEGIAEEEWEAELGIFPVCRLLVILLGASSLLSLRRRLRGGSDVCWARRRAILLDCRGPGMTWFLCCGTARLLL